MNTNLRILVVEDIPADVELITHELRRAGVAPTCLRVDNREQFLRELESGEPDLILSDHGVPGFDAVSAFQLARERLPDVPFVVVTGSTHEFDPHLPLSADGYVRKSQLRQLWPVVRQAILRCSEGDLTDHIPLCLIRFNLAHLLREVMQDFLRSNRGRRVEWVIKPLPDVLADPSLLSCGIRTLVDSTLTITEDQPVTRIEIDGVEQQGEVIVYVRGSKFTVQNSALESTSRALANTRHVAQRHRGRAWAEINSDGGATFAIALPLNDASRTPPGLVAI